MQAQVLCTLRQAVKDGWGGGVVVEGALTAWQQIRLASRWLSEDAPSNRPSFSLSAECFIIQV